MAAVGLLVSGCVRVQVSMSLSGNDLVSGEVVAAAAANPATPQGPVLTVPKDMADQASAKPYSKSGYTGTQLTFDDLDFAQLQELISSGTNENGHFQLNLERQGDLVNLTGSADLTQVTTQGAQVQIEISFPGNVLNTGSGSTAGGGTNVAGSDDNGTVTWTLPAGQVSTFSATAEYTNGGFTRSWSYFVKALYGAGALIAVLIALLAIWARRRNMRKDAEQGAQV